ncbi:fumarylacetoacetate hydrolase family protein [Streptomyces sp. Li-HN-5-11]|uniref:fumarylacetoacetate hydrolase family protein n=1 Tax=Streptomyces sp. Li-HN-5-11 TaxID=3075432 RepID=UPI0028B0E3A4|nr:fumarylacetoacetate hydrolase family protein [Streptomyces sp. Li-HN-5-11]WNM31714.1 fumarylacetoacetate hydrolase family protein [Streptomyces sp. Li-HN-5-11]
MKLVTFEVSTPIGPHRRVGALLDEDAAIWDITFCTARGLDRAGTTHPFERADLDAPPAMTGFLAAGHEAVAAAQHEVAEARKAGDETYLGRRLRHDLDSVRLLAPVPRPPSIRDFLMVREHVENAFARLPPDKRPPHSVEDMARTPGHWKGNPDSVHGPEDTVPYPAFTDELDFELELAVVIGRPGRDVSVEDAPAHIAGFTIFNDWSARDIQMEEMKIGLGPGLSKDFAFSIGPCIRTPDDFDAVNATMTARVDGEEWSRGTIGDMLRTFPELVSWVSRAQTLQPGDVIAGGTIANGCGLELGKYVPPGSLVELEVEGIGRLANRVSEKAREGSGSWPR